MARKISKKDEILERLRNEGKIVVMDKPADQQLVLEMNESLIEIRREYQVKERESQISASRVILTS